jgi:hypothetical protein
MAHHEEINDSSIENPDVLHEESDVRVRPLVWSAVWLSVATAVVMLIVWGMFRYMDGEAKKQDERERSPLADQRNPIPPAPRLQIGPTAAGQTAPDITNNSPLSEIIAVRREEKLKLENYTWLDQSKGVVELPIDRAKDLAIERGLFKARPPQAPAATPATAPAPTPTNVSESTKPSNKENLGPGQPTGNAPGQGAPKKRLP